VAAAATTNVRRVRATTRSHLPRACPGRAETALRANAPAARVRQPVPGVPVRVLPVPLAHRVHVRAPRVRQVLPVHVLVQAAETVLLPA
jgi:hypothetical protein